MEARNTATRGRRPFLVKIAPDQTEQQMDDIAEVTLASGVHGMIIGNTTVTRPSNLPPHLAGEAGGLSGKTAVPAFDRSSVTDV